MRVSANAKLNLLLHVTGKRADGYHLLDSLVAFCAFGDSLDIHEAESLSLEITGEFAPQLSNDENNLVLRAARLIAKHGKKEIGARMVLHKNIPVGAGLGGGSCDAAAAIRGLQQFWQLSLTHDQQLKIAQDLGSDVMVCVEQVPAWISGVGDLVSPVRLLEDVAIILVNPKQPLLTADVYRAFAGNFSAVTEKIYTIQNTQELLGLIAPLKNDLQPAAMQLMPKIKNMLKVLSDASGYQLARMTGSGATCFGIFSSQKMADEEAERIKQNHPDWWVVSTYLMRQ